MRRSLTTLGALALTPLVALTLTAAPAQAATGTASFSNAKGMDITLTDPVDGQCYTLVGPDTGYEGAAWRANRTDTTATEYTGPHCNGASNTLPPGAHITPMWGYERSWFSAGSVKFG
ncbi:hypothetical protein AB0H82_27620 [Streptomyces sp. NPDC050732]|uniref:hypothetical protein n=1 Tax=Streptomyces sp. NPDC050732 TaxID=3154632 RepID=UPI0034482227